MLERLAHLADVGGGGSRGERAFRSAQTFRRNTRGEGRDRREPALLGVRDDARELEDLVRDVRVERGVVDLRPAPARGVAPALRERREELVQRTHDTASRT